MKLLVLLFLPFLAMSQKAPVRLSGSTGTVYSTNYPTNYDNSENQQYIITVDTGNYIHLTFLDFLTEDGYDVLTLSNGTTYSGDLTGLSISIDSCEVSFTFTSDLTTTFRGFAIQWDSYPLTSVFIPQNICSNVYRSPFSIITSPNFPYNYPDNISCDITISVQDGHLISLQFVAFNTEDGYDILSVYNGDSKSAPLIGEFSGKKLPATITSSGNSLYLSFRSDLVNNFSGFSGLYTSFVSNDFKRGVLPQVFPTESALRRDENILKWLKKKAESEKIIPKLGASAANFN